MNNSIIVRNIDKNNELEIRKVLEIYSYYVENTAITFECTSPDFLEFKNRIFDIIEKYPFLVAVENECVVGYAYASVFNERCAYKHCAELSIYVNKDMKKKGIGKKLYSRLESELTELEITNLYACIAYPVIIDECLNYNSIEFHKHLGFNEVGHFHNCGYKFNTYYDMVYVEKIICD